MAEKQPTTAVVISLEEYAAFRDMQTRYDMLAKHIKCVLKRKSDYGQHVYEDAFFRAVLGLPEEEEEGDN